MRTLGGIQALTVVSEAGLNRLMMRSRSEQAEALQDWVEEEVLPSIRRTSGYQQGASKSPVAKVARRLGCDTGTAKSRVAALNLNKRSHARLAKEGACPRDFQLWHNTAYESLVSANASKMRKALGQKPGETPLDRMSQLLLDELNHARSLTERKIREMAEVGVKLGMEDQRTLLGEITRRIGDNDLAELGDGFCYGVIEHETRGAIIDVVRKQITVA